MEQKPEIIDYDELEKQVALDIAKEMEKERKKEVPVRPNSIAIKQDGLYDIKDSSELFRVASLWVKSGMAPKGYDTPEKIITGLQYANELGLKGLTALRHIAIIRGRPSIWGELPLALVRRAHPGLVLKEVLIDKDYQEISVKNKNLHVDYWAAVCEGHVGGVIKESFFSLDDATKAGLIPSDSASAWYKYPKLMLKYRARSIFLKDNFPECLNSIEIAEYDHDQIPNEVDVTPTNEEKTKQLNERFK